MLKYDPYQKTDAEIKATFINGKKELDQLLEDLRPKNNGLSNQSLILTGKRGMGKSHFMKMLVLSIRGDRELSRHYLPVLFPEELFKAGTLYHFLRDALARTFSTIEQYHPTPPDLTPLREKYRELCAVRVKGPKKEQLKQLTEIERHFFILLRETSEIIQRKIIFILENLQDLLGRKLSDNELKRLRGFMQENNNTLIIIGSAVTIFEQTGKYGQPFYNFFKFRKLAGLSKEDSIRLIQAEAEQRGNHAVIERLETHLAAAELFRILTGGTPRLTLFLYDLLAESAELVTDDILKKLTELTPYFKSETENLSPAKQMIMDALCEGPPAQTATEIAEHLNESPGIVHENLKRLAKENKVRIADTGKGKGVKKSETFYTVSDYFYRIWFQIRQSVASEDNLKWMAELAMLLFNEQELERKAIQTYAKVLEVKPDYHLARYHMGNSYAQLGEHQKAIHEYEKVVKIKPDHHQAWYGMANCHMLLGEHQKALREYRQWIKYTPSFPTVSFATFIEIKKHAGELFAPQGSIKKIIDPNTPLAEKLQALSENICLDRFDGLETLAAELFHSLESMPAAQRPHDALKELYFYLMNDTILRLGKQGLDQNPVVTARYYLKTLILLDNNRHPEKNIIEFLHIYLYNTDSNFIDKNKLERIFASWREMRAELPEVASALIAAIQDPTSRQAQVWSADPLFKLILSTLRTIQTTTGENIS